MAAGEDEGVLHRHGVQPLGGTGAGGGPQLNILLEPHVRQSPRSIGSIVGCVFLYKLFRVA